MNTRQTDDGATRLRAGVDIGGTFTDILLFDGEHRTFTIGKTLTTPDDPARAVRTGLLDTLRQAKSEPVATQQIIHGTTLVTNALIERKGAVTGLITTRGYRDAVEIGREHRYDLYDLFLERPEPLAPRFRRYEVDERIYADGTVARPLDLDDLRRVITQLQADGVEAVAVALLHSYQNAAHERAIGQLLAELAPEIVVSLSSDVVPEIREYERSSTTLANVYVRPLVDRYLASLDATLRDTGFAGKLFIMLASGGVCTVDTARRYPIRLIESGPAAGALAAAHYGRLIDRPSLLSFDMGGTTAKACLIDDGQPEISADFEVSRVYRFKQGSGLPIKVPVINMIEIGAGGGSIARVDRLGLLKVGPDSAGADPGPACYGRGGTGPTVTDADLLLGYLDPAFFLGGSMALDRSAAEAAVSSIAGQLGLGFVETAWGIHNVVNEQMAAAARIHAIEQGKDPRAYPVFAFGGAGPVHAYRVAEILHAPELIVPLGAGVTSTVGFLFAPLAFDFVRSYVGHLDALDWDQVNSRFAEMEQEGGDILIAAGATPDEISLSRSAELRYVGQGHEISVAIPNGILSPASVPAITAAFEQTYRALYGRTAPGNAIEAMSWRLVARAPTPGLPLHLLSQSEHTSSEAAAARKGTREIYLPEVNGFRSVPIYDRYRLGRGARFSGPAVVEERESTVVIGSGAAVLIDDLMDLVIIRPR